MLTSNGIAEFRPPEMWLNGDAEEACHAVGFRRFEYGKGYAEQGDDGSSGVPGLDSKCVVN